MPNAVTVIAPRSGRSVSISTGTGRLAGAVTGGTNSTSKLPPGFPGQRQYAQVLQAVKGARPSEAVSFRQEMEAMDSVRKEEIGIVSHGGFWLSSDIIIPLSESHLCYS